MLINKVDDFSLTEAWDHGQVFYSRCIIIEEVVSFIII